MEQYILLFVIGFVSFHVYNQTSSNRVLRMKNTIFKLLLYLFSLNSSAQQRFNTTIGIESYIFEYYIHEDYNANNGGQAITFQNFYNLNNKSAVGFGTGFFYHQRKGYSKVSKYSYVPIQILFKFHTLSNRFQLSLGIGIPEFFSSTDDYIGSEDFWYKVVKPEPIGGFDSETYGSQILFRENLFMVNNIRFHFKLSQSFYLTTGFQHYWYSQYPYGAGTHIRPNEVTNEHLLNLSLGLEYHFNWKMKQKAITE